MKVVLDTNICVAILNDTSQNAADTLKSYRRGQVGISSVVYFELATGALKSENRDQNLRTLSEFAHSVQILELTAKDAMEAARIRAYLEKRGAPIGAFDTLIAGQARARSLILATNNLREFGRVPDLKAEDWLSA